ncbi:MAG TPA: asparagine synthase B [Candidatus Polarisedimenticolaceae bacterium]|nr:asparagine synthase B [Candidatus Polarisedimenticolaceae bacterium]
MCGIFCLLNVPEGAGAGSRDVAVRQARLLRHRGPDWSGVWAGPRAVLAHERLAIVDLLHGAQPLRSRDGALVLAVNGEIYNHRELRSEIGIRDAFGTDSDCEVILPLWRSDGPRLVERLRGMFAFALYDSATNDWLIARDPIGIVPLYVGRRPDGALAVASEMKALLEVCDNVEPFPPGHYQTSRDTAPVRYWNRDWFDFDAVADRDVHPKEIHDALADSVHAHLMTDVPYGVLLSGGLDSSVIGALAAGFAGKRVESGDREGAWWPRLHSFAIGLAGSPDLAAAARAAEGIGTVHHGFEFTVQEGLDALRDVIWHIESFDTTTVRASTPMYLMARRIRATGVKMVLSGEGSDEIFGGYLYFHKAPNPRAFHEELVRKLQLLHLYDCLRANKSMAAWGIEARVPFLDTRFLDAAMRVHARHKMVEAGGIEKRIVREAFAGMLPEPILWRQKEQFSDGVGYSWIDSLKAYAEARVSDADFAGAAERFPIGTPQTKESFLYRAIFDELFPGEWAARTIPSGPSVACSSPAAIAWDPSFAANADPSGRAVKGVHKEAV